MKQFEHLIITRFNVRTNYGKANIGIDPGWLSHRFKLFEKFCYPSVKSQSNQNFKWLVFFDSETPEEFKNKILEYSKWSNFISIYIDCQLTYELNKKNILKNLTDGTKYLITTRLDNDDAVSKEFVQVIQDNFQEQKFEFINLTHGYVWSDFKLYSFKYSNNPFMSLIEKIDKQDIDGFKTVGCGDHTQLSSMGRIKQIKTKPAWIQVVHGKNVSNRIRGIRQPIKKLSGNFVISPESIPAKEQILPYLLDWGWSSLKFPIDSLVISLPKDVRSKIKIFLKFFRK
ncbi:MAG: glycosyltransferase [Mastigocoleus sp. MO_167.B18]|nr:glycosyltransferase [Mastigocoleus sp. MO_167.B18]